MTENFGGGKKVAQNLRQRKMCRKKFPLKTFFDVKSAENEREKTSLEVVPWKKVLIRVILLIANFCENLQ